VVSVLLVGAIVQYDAWLKRTFIGPVGMGLCRFLNVLFGLTVVSGAIPLWGLVMALAVGVYIAGVTWFARREARASKQMELMAALLVMLTGLALALFLPVVGTQLARTLDAEGGPIFQWGTLGHVLFPYLLVAYGFWIGIPAAAAIRNPMPKHVQRAVKRSILGLIIFDAILATALAGTAGLLILLLLPPAVHLGRTVYST
jgi:4-hydroxybenzoate polyprenyltransferase